MGTRRNLEKMSRILYGHRWGNLSEWVHSVETLADLTDEEIIELQRLAHRKDGPACFA